jgi:Beta-lactamase enzyme family
MQGRPADNIVGMSLLARLLILGLPLLLLVAGCTKDDPSPTDNGDVATSADEVTATAEPHEATSTVAPASTNVPAPTPTVVPEPSSDPVAIGEDMLDLQEAMEAAVAAYWVPGVYAVAVTDLQTGETVGVRGDERQFSGCSVNLFVLFQVAADVAAGRYPLETVDALVRATTWSSNAKTARDLYVIAGNGDGTEGVRRLRELIEGSFELEDVLLDHPPAFHEYSLGVDYNNYVTAEAMNHALATLWAGDVIDGEMRDYLLEVMTQVKPGLNYLSAAVPEGIVSHKNGFFYGSNGYVDNDVGIIRLQRGDREYAYALSFLSQQVPTEYGDVTLGQELGALAYEVMSMRYPAVD